MISELRKNRSLTFYQPTMIHQKINFSSIHAGGVGSTAISATEYNTATTTMQFNNQFNEILNTLHAEREHISEKVMDGLSNSFDYKRARNDGVKLAWDYEKADVEMGGTGSANWNVRQRQEIKETGKVRGAEGHHQKNVANHPKEQGNPDNIKFYKSRQEHLQEGHNGNFQNESDAPYIDKDKILQKTNGKRIFRNEIKGIGIAAAIGVGVGFTLGFTVSLAQCGVNPESLKHALAEGGKISISSGIQSIIGYGIGRTLGQLTACALEANLSNIGVVITDNISKMCEIGIVGTITIAVFSTYQFIKLIYNTMPIKEATARVGKQAIFSLSLLAVSIAAQGIWGKSASLIVSISTGIILITYSIVDAVHQRHYSEFIRAYMIDECKPTFI